MGFASLGALVIAGVCAMAAVVIPRSPQILAAQAQTAPQGAVPPSVAALVVLYVVMAVVALGLAVWGGATVVGLLRLKQWARISIMIQGGLVALAAGLFAVGAAVAPLMMKSMQMPANVSQSQLNIVFACFALGSGLIALIGVWWIVYFAMRGPREAFEPAIRPGQRTYAPRAMAAPAPPAQTGPITDFSIAQPIPFETPRSDEPENDPHDE